MATSSINFNSVIAYSKKNCVLKSLHLCATYVKKAFQAGGCTYVSGNGWNNQSFCQTNGFKCIGDFEPTDRNPRAHGGVAMQWPSGYKQQIGDICLIKHGSIGHICYATGTGINDWVSDYWQKSPGQANGTGPYCYKGSIDRVQFWRHSSVMNNTPEVDSTVLDMEPENKSVLSAIFGKKNTSSSSTVSVSSCSGMTGSRSKNKQGYTVLGTHMNQKD